MTFVRFIAPLTSTELPSAPDLRAVRRAVEARLEAIEHDALPTLTRHRELLERVWRSEEADAVPVFVSGFEAVPCHPAGAERLGDLLADAQALRTEAAALRGLRDALADYETGGAALSAALDEDHEPALEPALAAAFSYVPAPAPLEATRPDARQAYTRWLLAYAIAVHGQLWKARDDGDADRVRALQTESTELIARIGRHTGRSDRGPAPAAPALPRVA